MRVWVIVALALAVSACATNAPLEHPQATLEDGLFAPASVRIRADDVFALTPEMKQYLDTDVARAVRARGSQQGLFEALQSGGRLSLDYDSTTTRNAAQAFAARSGNCLSLVIMTAAFAKGMGMAVRYQSVFTEETWGRSGDFYLSVGHVNLALGQTRGEPGHGNYDLNSMTIDFLPPADVRGLRYWIIDEATIVAMYMNNRAVETLTSGDVNDAYWWAREAILQSPRFMSAYNTLGVVYQKHGNLAQAQRALEYVLEREPANANALSNLASVLAARGDLEAAQRVRSRLASIEPEPPFAYFKRGLAAMKQGDYELARDMFRKEVDRAAYYHEFRFWLALAYVGLGDAEKARKEMTLALENATTRKDHELYAAKLDHLKSLGPIIRR